MNASPAVVRSLSILVGDHLCRKGGSMENLTANTSTVLELIKSMMSLFGEFPLNLILVASLGGVAFKLFRKGRKAAG